MAIIALVIVLVSESETGDRPTRTLSDVIADGREGLVAEIEVVGDSLRVTMTDGREFESRKEEGTSIVAVLTNSDVDVGGADGVVVEVGRRGGVVRVLGPILAFTPLLLVATIVFVAARWLVRR